MNRARYLYPLILFLLLACNGPLVLQQALAPAATSTPPPPQVDRATIVRAIYESTAVDKSDAICSGTFVAHTLEHSTVVPGGEEVRMFEANGGGVAINDLDGDGDLDILLANHAAPNSLLWNEGGLSFRKETIGEGDARAATIVDVDGDSRLDIVFSRRASAPNYWHNEGAGQFTLTPLPGVDKPLYAINWGDLDGDGDLDLVGGTYDAGLLTDFGVEFLNSGRAGVYVYENDAGTFRGTRLADNAQAMALILPDLNEDRAPDILVGNDFGVPDYAWLNTEGGWQAAALPTMSHSTMSLAEGDVDNSGSQEIFSTDMLPYSDDPQTQAAWAPLMEEMMAEPHIPDDPQIMANVLQTPGEEGGYANEAAERGVAATGWSWSSKFGDLDQDGLLDLYVVNGFIEKSIFAHLPDHELVEENQALRNTGDGFFEPARAWNLGSRESGRGMSMGDVDNDGDLDIVVNNLRGPAQLFENQLCSGDSLQVELRWPGSGNTAALGAELALGTSVGTLYRTVTAASGYLSGDPARVHFGFPEEAELQWLEIRWPDGRVTPVEYLDPGAVVTITRGAE